MVLYDNGTIMIAKQELNLHVENQCIYIGHDKQRTADQIYLLDSNRNIIDEMFRRSSYLSYCVFVEKRSHHRVPTG